MGADLGDERDVKFFPRATRNLLDYFIITVADEALDEFVGECAVKVELVPVLLIQSFSEGKVARYDISKA